jgi:hypothetical protein
MVRSSTPAADADGPTRMVPVSLSLRKNHDATATIRGTQAEITPAWEAVMDVVGEHMATVSNPADLDAGKFRLPPVGHVSDGFHGVSSILKTVCFLYQYGKPRIKY